MGLIRNIFSRKARNQARELEFEEAVFWKDTQKMKRLLQRGVDPNGRAGRQTFLGKAVQGQSLEVINILLDAGADARQPFKYMGFELTMSEGAESIGASPDVVERLKRAEKEAVAKWGPGPDIRRMPAEGCCFLPKR